MDYIQVLKDLISIDTSVPPGLNYGKAIDYLEPLFKDGGYIPWCDHHVPPDVSLENYLYYVKRMKEASILT